MSKDRIARDRRARAELDEAQKIERELKPLGGRTLHVRCSKCGTDVLTQAGGVPVAQCPSCGHRIPLATSGPRQVQTR